MPEGDVDKVGVGGDVAVTGLVVDLHQRCPAQPLRDLLIVGHRVAGREGALGLAGPIAQHQGPVQSLVGALGGTQTGPDRGALGLLGASPLDRVEDTVDGQRPDPVRIQVGVHLTEVAAVGEAQVGQLLVAHRPAEQIHVPRHLGGRHRTGQGLAGGGAALGVLVVGLGERLLLLGPVRESRRVDRVQHRCGLARGGEALHVLAERDTAGIEADHVEPISHSPAEKIAREVGHLGAGTPRTTGVDEQGADLLLLVLRRHLQQRQLDLLTLRLVVVERNLHRRTLGVAITGVPVELRGLDGLAAPLLHLRGGTGRRVRRRGGGN